MRYEEFVEKVQDRISPARPDEAERAVAATLDTLADRLSHGEARDLAAQLPEELKGVFQKAAGGAEGFSLEEFYRRVAKKEGVSIDTATGQASAVMAVLGEAISDDELEDIRSQLPQEFYHLFE